MSKFTSQPVRPAAVADSPDAFLQLAHLSKSYQEGAQTRIVLQDASLEIAQGEFIAIFGKSGTGKTTLLNLVSGIDRADQGEVFLEGVNLTGLSENQRTLLRRRKIGFIFQFFNLIPTLTVWENVTLPLELNGRMDSAGKRRAQELLSDVGLAGREKTFPDRLSGGEQQRVAIARALVHNPALLLADEPTGNLDEETGRQVLDLLDRLTRQSGKNLVMVTHSSDVAARVNRSFWLREGKLMEHPA